MLSFSLKPSSSQPTKLIETTCNSTIIVIIRKITHISHPHTQVHLIYTIHIFFIHYTYILPMYDHHSFYPFCTFFISIPTEKPNCPSWSSNSQCYCFANLQHPIARCSSMAELDGLWPRNHHPKRQVWPQKRRRKQRLTRFFWSAHPKNAGFGEGKIRRNERIKWYEFRKWLAVENA